MARTGGRNPWIAVPATMLSFAVVAALVWLATPMVPVAISWIGDSLRDASERAAQEASPTPDVRVDPATLDCRGLYPERLWVELSWTGGALLDQGYDAPTTAAPELVDALAPDVVVACTWTRSDGGSIATTLSEVGADAGDTVAAALRVRGFSCEGDGAGQVCERERGSVREEHVVRDGFWLVSVETRWWPEDYGAEVATRVFG